MLYSDRSVSIVKIMIGLYSCSVWFWPRGL